jgi:nitrate reductase beta subunit
MVRGVLHKLLAIRIYMRRKSVEGEVDQIARDALQEAGLTEEEAQAIYQLTTQPSLDERFVLPPYHREMSVEVNKDPLAHKGLTGLGYLNAPQRGA